MQSQPNRMRVPLRLCIYVEKVLMELGPRNYIGTHHPPFNSATASRPPFLNPRGMNRILLFPGAFNPPHVGHIDLLQYVFQNAGADLNVIAAIIIPTDDSRLSIKTKDEEKPLVLRKAERVSLLTGPEGIPDWAWVWEQSEDAWREFRRHLLRVTEANHIKLKFLLVGGPDYVGRSALQDPAEWGCEDLITSDVSRPVDFRYPYMMRQLPGCSPWREPYCDMARLRAQIRAEMRGRPGKEVDEAIDEARAGIKAVYVCREHNEPKGFIRFVPRKALPQPSDAAPSSTDIRKMIATTQCPEELELKLRGVALNPAWLIKYLSQHKVVADDWTR